MGSLFLLPPKTQGTMQQQREGVMEKDLARCTQLRREGRREVLYPVLGNLWGQWLPCQVSQDLQWSLPLHHCLYGGALEKPGKGHRVPGLGCCQVEKKKSCRREMLQNTRMKEEVGSSDDQVKHQPLNIPSDRRKRRRTKSAYPVQDQVQPTCI